MPASSKTSYVFYSPEGGHYRRSNFARRVFRSACDGRYEPVGGRPGSLRHSHKTWMAEDGIPEILAEQRLGHHVPGRRGLYAHASQRMREDLLAALQARWEESPQGRADIHPHSRVPLLSVIGLSLAASLLAEQYALYGLATARGSVPAARLAGQYSGGLAAQTVMLLFFLILLFPDGRLPSRRWRPVLWAMFAVAVAWPTRGLQAGSSVMGGISEALFAAKVTYPNPLGIFPRHGWFNVLVSVILGPCRDRRGALGSLGVRPAARRERRAA